jgi:hypothetical protein
LKTAYAFPAALLIGAFSLASPARAGDYRQRDKVPVDAGVFQVRGGSQGRGGKLYKIDRLVEADKNRINAFAITLEPKGGLKQPSGKMYLLGSI